MTTFAELIALAVVSISLISLLLGLFGSSKEDSIFQIWFRGIKRFFYPFFMFFWVIFFWIVVGVFARAIKTFIRA